MKDVIDNAKPAHLLCVIRIASLVLAETKMYAGIAVSVKEKYYVKVVQ
jgi:hypothetical protein